MKSLIKCWGKNPGFLIVMYVKDMNIFEQGVLKMTRPKYLNLILRAKIGKKKVAPNHCMGRKQSVLYKLFLKKTENHHLRWTTSVLRFEERSIWFVHVLDQCIKHET